MKKIAISLGIIGVVAAIVIGATTAYFSDTETSTGNLFTAGTIDITVDGEDFTWEQGAKLEDLKPCETAYINFVISNPGNNPVNVWKHIKDVETGQGIQTEPEEEAENENPVWDIDSWILYDLSVKVSCPGGAGCGDPAGSGWWQTIYDENVMVADITSQYVFLGMIPAKGKMIVTQSYHLSPDTENEYQGDAMTFNIEIKAEQLRGELTLENKSEANNWLIGTGDGIYGELTYGLTGPTFDYKFDGYGLKDSTEYCLIYYADPWPGSGGTEIACGSTTGTNLNLSGSVNLGMDIPASGDNNDPDGGKIWLVLANDYDEANNEMVGWNPDEYLFETGLITYEDTND